MLSPQIIDLLIKGLIDTLQMVAVSGAIGTLIGLPIGVMLAVTGRASCCRTSPSTR